MSLFSEDRKPSWWNELLSFLWDGGARSLIVITLVGGATYITVKNGETCPGLPSVASDNNGTPKEGTPLIQPNPTCSKYFELVSLVIGGYLGLSLPRSGAKEKDSASESSQGSQDSQDSESSQGSESPESSEGSQSSGT